MLDYLLHGESRACWVVGNRRIGKTSLLRQLEYLASAEDHLIPLYWDMQGGDTLKRLGQYLADAIRDYSERFEALGLSPAALFEEDVFALLPLLRRLALRADRELLLLCDETEVLIEIAGKEPEAMQRLHRELTGGAGLRVVATSTRAIYQLHDVCRDWPTSPFLAGFDMSQTLGSLSPYSAHALITQAQAPEAERVRAAPDVVGAISDYTNNHPYLIQLLCARLFQPEGWLRPVTADDLHVDPLLKGFFCIDFNFLTETDREILWAVQQANVIGETALHEKLDLNPLELHQRLHNLERLGHLRRVYGQLAIGNQFLANWLSMEQTALRNIPAATTSESAMRTALHRQQAQEVSFLMSRLNARRERLVELEAERARDLLNVSPQVLAEIERTQSEIRHLRRLLDELHAAAQ
jgi:DNA-binding Lrp family transcriptional regulator